MAGTSERRVGKLRLAASSAAAAQRGRIVLEDALRTASLPQAEGGRVLVVRSLALGKFRAGQSSAGVALAIERRLKQLGAQAVYALDPHAARAPAVYFRDDAECSLALAARLTRGGDVSAWFWPLAAPDWRRSLPRDEALRRLLFAATRAEGGVVAAASMLRELRVRGGVEVMLNALGWADGPRLLRACEWRPPPQQSLPFAAASASRDDEELTPLGGGAQDLLARWAAAWGPEDARSLWLSALLLVEAKSARLLDARLTSRALRLIKRVTTHDAPAATTIAPGRVSQARSGSSNEHSNDASLGEAEATRPPAPTRDAITRDHAPSLEEEGRAVAPPDSDVSAEAGGRVEEDMKSGNAPGGDPRELTATVPGVADEPLHESAPTSRDRSGAVESHDSPYGSTRTPHDEGVPVLSVGAGLFFLVPVMSRLGVAALLEANPHLVELSFPQRLLRRVCERVGVPEDDAVLRALDEEDEVQPPSAVAAHVASASSPGLTLPLDEWTRAMRRWCRRHARIGLRELVRREGYLLWTRTHIDVLFDDRRADFRIRKSALDIDPGWVAWLGRVVLFHYRERGDGDW